VADDNQPTPDLGASLFRLYLVDVDTDPMNPEVRLVYKRGAGSQDLQKRVRAYLNGEDEVPADEAVYEDEACTTKVDFGPDHNWGLAVMRKAGKTGGKAGGLDKKWVALVLSNPDLTPEQKIAEIQKYT
jgi:hypothetical protein